IPCVTSTMHSLHFPFLWQEVGTWTATVSAQSNTDAPRGARVICPLIVSSTDNYQAAFASSSAFTACATSCAEPVRSCSSPHFHCARYASELVYPRFCATASMCSANLGDNSTLTSLPASSSAFTCEGIS